MKKASITLFLCLILAVMLTLISTALISARSAAGRAVFSSAAEQGMYSLFSRYDRKLFDDYGILALDGGYGGTQLKLGALQDEAEEIVSYIIGDSGEIAGPTNLTKLSLERGEVTGYTLLTDQGGAAYQEQVLRALAGKLTEKVLDETKEKLGINSTKWKELEEAGKTVNVTEIQEEYRNIPRTENAEADRTGYREKETRAILCEQSSGPVEDPAPETVENPIEMVLGLQKLGILKLVIPGDKNISAAEIESDCVSRRTLQTGMGIVEEASDSLVDKTKLLEYLVDTFPNFTSADEDSGTLLYQAEYAIGHKNSDTENLKIVLNRLLAVREAANYMFLLKDPVKQEEVQAAALALGTLLGIPVAQPILAQMLNLCWAYGESVLDLRELLKGGKIALVKDSTSWQLSLENLIHLQTEQAEQHSSQSGLDYSWYLRLLLVLEDTDSLTGSMMDLTEHQIRHTEGHEGFRLDNCLVSMKIRFCSKQDDLFLLNAERSYNYTQ